MTAARRPVPPIPWVDLVFVVSYHGIKFQGFQWQPPVPSKPGKHAKQLRTVEGTLAIALERLGLATAISTVSRTDASVSAREHLCWARLPLAAVEGRPSAETDIVNELNAVLPLDLRVIRAKVVRPSQINLKAAAVGKEYVYHVSWGAWAGVRHLQPFTHHLHAPPNIDAMRIALQSIVGKHDFGAFVSGSLRRRRRSTSLPTLMAGSEPASVVGAAGVPGRVGDSACAVSADSGDAHDHESVGCASSSKSDGARSSAVRTIWVAELTLKDPAALCFDLCESGDARGRTCSEGVDEAAAPVSERHEALRDCPVADNRIPAAVLRISIQGDGFMRHQVRRIVGALLQVGRGELPVEFFSNAIRAAEAASAAANADAEADELEGGETRPCIAATALASFRSHCRAAPGRGLWLQRTLLPDTFWSDPEWCNNGTPGYCVQWGLALQPSGTPQSAPPPLDADMSEVV